MTLKDIEAIDREFLTPAEVASVLQCAPQAIRDQASKHPELLGFHCCKVGNRVKIPRLAFIAWMAGNET